MRGVRRGVLATTAVLMTFGSWAMWTFVTRTGELVPLAPWAGGVLLLLMGAAVLWFAWPVRRYLAGKARKGLDAIRAARAAALAQAAALTGAVVFGWYAGQLLVVVADLSLEANVPRMWRLVVHAICSVALVVAGLVAQSWCRIPPADEVQASPPTG